MGTKQLQNAQSPPSSSHNSACRFSPIQNCLFLTCFPEPAPKNKNYQTNPFIIPFACHPLPNVSNLLAPSPTKNPGGDIPVFRIPRSEFRVQPAILLEAMNTVQHINTRQGPRNVDLRTPPGPEGSNGSLLDICRGHPGIFFNAK